MNKFLETKTVKGTEDLESKQSKRNEGFKKARAHLAAIMDCENVEAQAAKHLELYPDYPRDHFLETTSRKSSRVREALGNGEGWACRLHAALKAPHAYTLHASHLGLPPSCSDPANFYSKANRELWQESIKKHFSGSLHWKLELAERVHVHIIADENAGLPHIKRGGEVIKPITHYEGWLFYIAKPAAQWNARNLALWMRAKRMGRLPRLSGTMGLANRTTFHKGANDILSS